MRTSKLRTFVGQSAYFEPRLTFCYLDALFKNSALARDVLKISLIFVTFLNVIKTSKLRSSAERLQNFDDVLKNRVLARDVFKISSICRLQGEVLGGSF